MESLQVAKPGTLGRRLCGGSFGSIDAIGRQKLAQAKVPDDGCS